MDELREKLVDVIASALPESLEVEEFCQKEHGGFSGMLDDVMIEISEHCKAMFD